MSSQPTTNLSTFITQWISRLENHQKKIAQEEKITEMRFGAKVNYYIQHAEEGNLPSSDKRREILYQYKNLANVLEHLKKEKKVTENLSHLLERVKDSAFISAGKKSHVHLNKLPPLISDFQSDLDKFLEYQKKSQPSQEIKR